MAGMRVAWEKAKRDQGPLRASALAYATLVSLVPTVAIVMAILSAPWFERSREEFLDRMAGVMVPADGPDGATRLLGTVASDPTQERFKRLFREQIDAITSNLGTVSLIGFLALMTTVYLLMNAVEKTFNQIWEVRTQRTIFQKIAVYTAIIFWAPIMAALSFSLSGYLSGTGMGVIAPTLLMALSFTGVFAVLPNVRVRARPAFLGGLVTAVLWEFAKLGFLGYVVHVAGHYKVYGSLGILPMLFIWVYVNWLVILFGVEISYCVQNLDDMRLHARMAMTGKGLLLPVGLRLAAEVADGFLRGEKPVPLDRLAMAIGVPFSDAAGAADKLCERGVLARVQAGRGETLSPARAPGVIHAAEVLDALDWPVPPRQWASAEDPAWRDIHALLSDVERNRRDFLKDMTLETLALRLRALREAHAGIEEEVVTKSFPAVPPDDKAG